MSKILFVTFGFYPEQHGVAEVAYRQAVGLHALGHEVYVLTRPCVGRREMPFEIMNFEGNKADYQAFLTSWVGDIILFHGWHTWVSDWAVPILKNIKAQKVMVSHGTTAHLRYAGLKGWARWLLQRPQAWQFERQMTDFDHFVFLSDHPDPVRMTDVVIAQKRGFQHVSYLPNGASLTDYPVQHTFEKPSDKKMLLCVSNFIREKGQRELIAWFLDMQRPDAVLVLVGSEFNTFSAQLQKQAGEALNQTVFFYEQLPKQTLMDAYRVADVLVSATYTEVLPLMLLDAMAAGVPFLCRNVGAVGTLEGGEIFTQKSDFQRQLHELLTNDALRQQLGEAGKKSVQSKYNWPTITQQYDQLIQKLLHR
ncbi:MAG: glycosyltransferase family 4 protein [Spirosomaceae bacterium]|nr:glycosyltransferase family 4 protein [Spirosomataceae bacterium]